MTNEVTAYGILKALKSAKAPTITRDIAILANIDTTSENLMMIRDELYDFAELGFVEVNTTRNRNVPWFKVIV